MSCYLAQPEWLAGVCCDQAIVAGAALDFPQSGSDYRADWARYAGLGQEGFSEAGLGEQGHPQGCNGTSNGFGSRVSARL
jgi:hypothetical protein